MFAMALDVADRLLAAVSGNKSKLIRFGKETKILFESEVDHYIYAIRLDEEGSIYLATGPQGRIYRLPPFGGQAELIYESRDKNILSLAFASDGSLLGPACVAGDVGACQCFSARTVPDVVADFFALGGAVFAAGFWVCQVVSGLAHLAYAIPDFVVSP